MDIDSDTLGIPDTEYDVCVTMPSSEFGRIVRDLSALGESVKIDVSKDGVRFTAEGESANGNILLKQTASARRNLKLVGKKEKKTKVKKEEVVMMTKRGMSQSRRKESSSKKKKKTKVKREEGGSDVEMVGDDDDDEAKPDEDEDEDEGSESTSKKRKKAPSKVRVSLADGFISDLILVTSLLNPPSALKGPRTKMKMKSKEGCRSR
jgi:proliferating cell nuclear antigen